MLCSASVLGLSFFVFMVVPMTQAMSGSRMSRSASALLSVTRQAPEPTFLTQSHINSTPTRVVRQRPSSAIHHDIGDSSIGENLGEFIEADSVVESVNQMVFEYFIYLIDVCCFTQFFGYIHFYLIFRPPMIFVMSWFLIVEYSNKWITIDKHFWMRPMRLIQCNRKVYIDAWAPYYASAF